MPTFATPEPITATLTTAGAEVRIAASDRLDTVVLVEPIDSANKSDVKVAERTKVEFTAGELSVKTTKSGDKDGSVAITVELPAGSRLVLHTAWTDVHADGRLGECELNMASGQVQLDHVAALRANLAAGGVAIGHIAGTAEIEGGAAGVRIGEVEGTVRYEGSTGKVWIGHARSDVDLGGSSGSFDIDRAEGSVTAKAGNCPIRIGRMTRGQADLTNASGGIVVGVSEGTAAVVDAKSTKGVVRNSLPTHDSAGDHDDKVRIYAHTRLDDVVIHPATA
ncbi:DUF4097 family beta strand repeat-containing protein [Phytohabitans sp. LJ34]|uniref:DUF4097 family beta strand repeat-containing protein n=1 Tax=Phytohabitans sp. LJ34 TaxID=3452217 RepID=UPI003F8A3696